MRKCAKIYPWPVNESMFYVNMSLLCCCYNAHFYLIIEDIVRKDNAKPVKAHAIPTKAQRPTSPRRITSPPPVSTLLGFFVLTNNACVSSLLYLNPAILLNHLRLFLLLRHQIVLPLDQNKHLHLLLV